LAGIDCWIKKNHSAGKNENSMTQVPLHPALAVYLQQWRRETLHSKDSDWVFDVNLKTAQTILRHKKLSTTADIYTHAVQSNQLAASGQYLDAIKMGSQSIN
jgi:integrase